ncbi:polysaccharide biosynthesis tyrosine autokinase [Pseudorhodobacter sp.]|uniref:polysaccharide biosynthesis tyrosine autokinase n=1 Tax=Pseudorhodobacter sp. TaxID=1934400 RepID=UPI0039E2CD26
MQSTEIDLNEMLGILRRQSRLILITLMLVLLPAIAYLLVATPMYRATSLISIDAGGSNLLDPGSVENSQSAILNSRVDGEVEVLRADATVMAVVEKADLINDPEFGPKLGLGQKVSIALGIESMGNRLRQAVGLRPKEDAGSAALVSNTITKLKAATDIRRRGLTYLISVSATSENPERAAAIANAYVEAYIARQVITKSASIIAARDVLQSQTRIAQVELTRLENGLNTFIDDNLARFEEESNSTAIAALRQQLESAKSSKVKSIETLANARDAAARNDWVTAAAALGDSALESLARERQQLENRLRGAQTGSQGQVDLQNALESLEKDLNQRLTQAQSTFEAQVSSITEAETRAREQMREALLSSDMSSSVISDLFNLQQSASIARNQYQQLLARVQDLNAMANVQIADARVVSEALPPISAASPNKKLIIALAAATAIGLGIVIAFLNEYYIGGVSSAAQLGNVIQVSAPIAVPALTLDRGDRLLADDIVAQPLSQYAESFRKLRLAIDSTLHHGIKERGLTPEALKKGKVILICSALPGEGKTTTAIALARTYAIAGKRTLLIDCDLRKPSVAKYFDLPQDHGLIDYLVTDAHENEPIVKPILDPMSELEVISAGARSSRPTDQLINSPKFTALIDAVRDFYHVIVLDSPPLLPVVDTRYLAQNCDAAIQVVRFANTTQGEVRDAANQVREYLAPGVKLLAVLNRQDKAAGKLSGYGSAYSGYYGDPNS